MESRKRVFVGVISALAGWKAKQHFRNSRKRGRNCARGKPRPPGKASGFGKAYVFPRLDMSLMVKPRSMVASIIVQCGFAQEALLEYIRTMIEDFTCSVEIS